MEGWNNAEYIVPGSFQSSPTSNQWHSKVHCAVLYNLGKKAEEIPQTIQYSLLTSREERFKIEVK